jgi:hypothetical protein
VTEVDHHRYPFALQRAARCAALAALCWSLALPATAQRTTTQQQLNPASLSAESKESWAMVDRFAPKSELVVVAKVHENRSEWRGKVIVTTSKVEILESLQGNLQDEGLEVAFLGGTVGVIHQDVTHEATLVEGEIALLFLAKPRAELAGRVPEWRIIDEHAALRLVGPGETKKSYNDHRRLRRFLDELRSKLRAGGAR